MVQTSKHAFAILVITCLMFHFSAVAQIKANYHFGFIGVTGDTTVKPSEPVIIQYSKCFDITNGSPRFSLAKSGVFSIACYEAAPEIKLLVHAYPNPVMNELTIRSLVSYPEKGRTNYRLLLTDILGRHIREVITNLSGINEGFRIPVNDLPAGYFIVTLFADKEMIQSFKILKGA